MFFAHLGPWFEATKDVLFGIEFLLVQVYLIYHLVRALFLGLPRNAAHKRKL